MYTKEERGRDKYRRNVIKNKKTFKIFTNKILKKRKKLTDEKKKPQRKRKKLNK